MTTLLKVLNVDMSALPWLKIWVKHSMNHTFCDNICKRILGRWENVRVSKKQHGRLVGKPTGFF